MRSRLLVVCLTVLSALGSALPAQQVRQVSLEDAIRLADKSSEAVEIARAAVARANGQQYMARSAFLPQISGSLSYGKTLKSQFEALASGGPDTSTFRSLCSPEITSASTPAERQAALDASLTCTGGGGIDFSKAGFGAKNSWTFGLQFSQAIFTGGRASGNRIAANAGRHAADIELTAQRAQLILDITQAYYNAVLATRLSDIAQTSLGWNEDVLRQTTRAREVGSSSEFDLLRAQVSRDNYIPVALARKSDRNIALLRLKQLLEIPLDDSLDLTTDIDVAPMPSMTGVVASVSATPDTSADSRATVREAADQVRAQEGLLRAARGERYPTIAVTSGYQRLWFSANAIPEFADYAQNWTVGFTISSNLFSGGRTTGGVMLADANLRDARARHKQAREFAALDSRITLSQLEQAEAAYRASQGTAAQARKAYSIDEIRYREGISTQTDLTQSRLMVEQAMVNHALAARDYAVARMRMVLLKDLPLSAQGAMSGAGAGAGAAAGMGGGAAAPAPQQPRTQAGATAGSTGSNQ